MKGTVVMIFIMVMVGVSISPNPPNSYETTCAYTDPTTGAFYNLTGMILNQGGPYYSYELQNTDVFQVNICNVVPPTYCSGLGIPTSVCQLSGTSQYSCGNVTTQTFSSLPNGQEGVNILYTGGTACATSGKRETNIMILCDTSAGQGAITSVVETASCSYNITMGSKFACAQSY